MSDAFVAAYQERHPDDTIDTLDVWSESLPQFGALSAAWKLKTMTGQTPTPEELVEVADVETHIARFLGADKHLLAIPMWNFSVPYRVKQYLDVIVQPGRTFGFDPAKGYFGLVPSERPVQLILSSAGNYAAGDPMAPMDFHRPYITSMLNFIGLSRVNLITVDCTGFGPQVSDPILARSIESAKAAAATF